MTETPKIVLVDDDYVPGQYFLKKQLVPITSGALFGVWFFPAKWYWFVQDSSPGTQVWQSSTGQFVVQGNADYAAFIAAGNKTASIDTFVNLCAYIDRNNQTQSQQFQGSTSLDASGGTLQLAGILPYSGTGTQIATDMTITVGGNPIKMPQANLFGSPPLGFSFLLTSAVASATQVQLFGAALVVVCNILAGQTWLLVNTSNATQAGNWVAFQLPDTQVWTSYTPTVTPAGGSLTGFVINAARFKQLGKTTVLSLDITVSTVGSATGAMRVSFPNSPFGGGCLVGREWVTVGKGLIGGWPDNATPINVIFADNTSVFLGGNGTRVVLSGVYENT